MWQVLGTAAADRYECRLFVPADKKAYIGVTIAAAGHIHQQAVG